MRTDELLESYERNGVLGELTGKSASGVDAFFRRAYRDAVEALDEARRRAAETRHEIHLDSAGLSGVNGGDFWIVGRDGRVTRELQRFPEVEAQLLAPHTHDRFKRPCASVERARPLLARCAYNGLWSPSGTNWQPIRTVELSAEEAASLRGEAHKGCALAVLARSSYQSVLGDIARLCGLEQSSHAESIDLGIWLLAAEQTARSHGWALETVPIGAGRRAQAAGILADILRRRTPRLGEAARGAAEALLASIEAGDHRVACLLVPHEGKPLALSDNLPGGLRPAPFDHLVEARSTQRVASPAGEMPSTALDALGELAVEWLAPGAAAGLRFSTFTWKDQFPLYVGRAMHDGIQGADGLLARADPARLRDFLAGLDDLPDELAGWCRCDPPQLEERGRALALPARLIPAHLRARLLEGGSFRARGELLVDHRDRPLSPVRLMKLVRMMARSFGKYFLSFQNTHPLLGVIAARTPPADPAGLHQAAGRLVAHMTFLARARGQVSVIKSGPVEIAGAAIRRILAEEDPGETIDEVLLTFQLGLPLGPDEQVCPGEPGEHDGLKERLLDRRAGRAPIARHYVPAGSGS